MADTTAPLLELRGVSFAYGSRRVLDGVDLSVSRGEMLGVIGPNGSGKSTLLRLMTGVLRPGRGEVIVEGRPLQALRGSDLARRLAAVPQEPAIDFPFSVSEVVLMGRAPHLGGRLFESDRDLEVADAAMRRTGVRHLADRGIHELSGGERQRVILARALAQETSILVLDEPTTFLDIRHVVEIYELLADLHQEGRTVIAALHDLNLAALYCRKVALLSGGRLTALGRPEEVITAANVRAAYDAEVEVRRDEASGSLMIVPRARRQARTEAT